MKNKANETPKPNTDNTDTNDQSGLRPGPNQGSAEAIGGPTITDSGLGAMEAGYTPNELEDRDANENYGSGNAEPSPDERSSRSGS